MTPLTEEWIAKAEGDFKVAGEQMQTDSPVHDVICFLSQQTAEKYLKGWLTEQAAAFPLTHDLDIIGQLCLPSLPERTDSMQDLRYLTTFAVRVRYPGMFAQPAHATQALDIARKIRTLIRSKLGLGT